MLPSKRNDLGLVENNIEDLHLIIDILRSCVII